ncbi:hypothetical protein CapIbe_015028 [Capra ibex]
MQMKLPELGEGWSSRAGGGARPRATPRGGSARAHAQPGWLADTRSLCLPRPAPHVAATPRLPQGPASGK